MSTRIVVADDLELMRLSFRMVIDSQPDLRVIGEAGTGLEAVDVVGRLAPDVVLMDVRMPTMDGVAATRAIVEADPDARIILVTTFDLDEYLDGALAAGASGLLLKDVPPARLLSAIRAVAAGEMVLPSLVSGPALAPRRSS